MLVSVRALSAAVSATLKRYYFGRLRANVNRITMSMLTCSQLPHDLLTIKKTLGMPLVKFENAKVELGRFAVKYGLCGIVWEFGNSMWQSVVKSNDI